MSQYLLCKANDLSRYGEPVKCEGNLDVLGKYFNGDTNSVWEVSDMNFMIDAIEESLPIIYDIIDESERMVFWYSDDYADLDKFTSRSKLKEYIRNNVSTPCLELYIYAEFKE